MTERPEHVEHEPVEEFLRRTLDKPTVPGVAQLVGGDNDGQLVCVTCHKPVQQDNERWGAAFWCSGCGERWELPFCEIVGCRLFAEWVYVGEAGDLHVCGGHYRPSTDPGVVWGRITDGYQFLAEPWTDPAWAELPAQERGDRMRGWRRRRLARRLKSQGLDLLGAYAEGATEWCEGCDGPPERGRDSHGDCADCGELVYWVMAKEEATDAA